MHKKLASLLMLIVVLAVMGCPNNGSVLSTRLEHIGSAAFLKCDAYGDSTVAHSCLVLSNPFQPMLRVYDVTEGAFLFAPIGYSPLAVRIDGLTDGMQVLDQTVSGFVFTSDANSARIFAFNARNAPGAPSFSILTPPPALSLPARVRQFFVLNNGDQASQVVAILDNGNASVASFDGKQFGAQNVFDLALGAPVNDAVYDSVSGLLALVLDQAGSQSVVLRRMSDIAQGLNGTSHSFDNVGRVKVAVGTVKTDSGVDPYLFLMNQIDPKVTVKRINSQTLAESASNTITLGTSVVKAYIPSGTNKEACCNGKAEWVAFASDNGFLYYLSADAEGLFEPDDKKVFNASLDIATDVGVSRDNFLELMAFMGGDTITPEKTTEGRRVVCARQIYFAYAGGFVGSVCEGLPGGVTVLVLR